MINNINEFHAQYKLLCKPAAEALELATNQYQNALKKFMIAHFCNEKEFEEWHSNAWKNFRLVFNCDRDYVTETMILDLMISEIECEFY
jgi:hypothetical protein